MVDDDWQAPQVDRFPEPLALPERAALEAWLDYFRDTLLTKCAGLDAEQLRRRRPAVQPVADRSGAAHGRGRALWFRRRIAGEDIGPIFCDAGLDGDFDDVDELTRPRPSRRTPLSWPRRVPCWPPRAR